MKLVRFLTDPSNNAENIESRSRNVRGDLEQEYPFDYINLDREDVREILNMHHDERFQFFVDLLHKFKQE